MADQIANTGNSMIPANPGIAAQQVMDGAQQVAPPSAGAPPTVLQPMVAPEQAPAPAPAPVEAYDFWSGVEQRVEPDQVQLPPAAVPAQEHPIAAVPQPSPIQPEPSQALSFEQQAAIVEAGAVAAPTPQQAPVQAQPGDPSQLEAQTIAHLARTEYALPEAEATRLVSEPEVVFPQLAARLHVRLASQIGQAMQQILPSIIEQVVDGKIKAQGLENDFFRTYPQLADPRFRPVVAQSLRMARQASPQAGRDQIMNDGAALAAMKLRLQLTQGAVQPVVLPQAPVPVQAAQAPVQPFQPALGGGAPLLPTQQAPVNEFEVLAMDTNW